MNTYADGGEQSILDPQHMSVLGERMSIVEVEQEPIRQHKLIGLLTHHKCTVYSVGCYLLAMWPWTEGIWSVSELPAVSDHLYSYDSFKTDTLVCIRCFLFAVKMYVTNADERKESLFWLLVRVYSQSRWERHGKRFRKVSG